MRRADELWRRLAAVCDPELDEPITELGFVERAVVAADGRVEVDFRLPTYWCSPNFAWLMLDGIRAELEALSWRPAWRLVLHDHMFADAVNAGLAEGRSFGAIFGGLAAGADLDELRRTFAAKAFQRRQEAVLLGLRRQGQADAAILATDLAAFDALVLADPAAAKQAPRYRAALLERWPSLSATAPVFVTWDGAAIPAAGLGKYLAELRRVRINMEFNGALCRGLKASRYKEVERIEGEPTLVDFLLERVPPRPGSSRPAPDIAAG